MTPDSITSCTTYKQLQLYRVTSISCYERSPVTQWSLNEHTRNMWQRSLTMSKAKQCLSLHLTLVGYIQLLANHQSKSENSSEHLLNIIPSLLSNQSVINEHATLHYSTNHTRNVTICLVALDVVDLWLISHELLRGKKCAENKWCAVFYICR